MIFWTAVFSPFSYRIQKDKLEPLLAEVATWTMRPPIIRDTWPDRQRFDRKDRRRWSEKLGGSSSPKLGTLTWRSAASHRSLWKSVSVVARSLVHQNFIEFYWISHEPDRRTFWKPLVNWQIYDVCSTFFVWFDEFSRPLPVYKSASVCAKISRARCPSGSSAVEL